MHQVMVTIWDTEGATAKIAGNNTHQKTTKGKTLSMSSLDSHVPSLWLIELNEIFEHLSAKYNLKPPNTQPFFDGRISLGIYLVQYFSRACR